MIEIISGSLEAQVISVLQQTYPITSVDLEDKLHVSQKRIERVLQKLQIKGIVRLQPFSDKTYIRLLRNDFHFIGGKHQQKSVKHERKKKKHAIKDEYDGIMYS